MPNVNLRQIEKINTSDILEKFRENNNLTQEQATVYMNDLISIIIKYAELGYVVNVNSLVTLYPSPIFYETGTVMTIKAIVSENLKQSARTTNIRWKNKKKRNFREVDTG